MRTYKSEAVVLTSPSQAIQTPKQRLANEKFYKKHEKQMGKPKPKTKKESPVSTGWISKCNIPTMQLVLPVYLPIYRSTDTPF
ncbi:unnamed protein product [Cyberlindnera jadinii]|uniref:Stress-associated endoplasmic reticulum protein n=1 Tax=Cyberlindnera jadinii (strain ATCC 18201 / CBS 1600 / BCRC 20928 / JCM 3617 / NBRC 0987 / NRRL Y-1542) TaxID=983966 RepID=A0A0H5C2T2_CYBJN|nr:unnamed protein product [Cyberlindnera jadinii]